MMTNIEAREKALATRKKYSLTNDELVLSHVIMKEILYSSYRIEEDYERGLDWCTIIISDMTMDPSDVSLLKNANDNIKKHVIDLTQSMEEANVIVDILFDCKKKHEDAAGSKLYIYLLFNEERPQLAINE